MPNNVTTAIEITGPKDKIAKLIKDTKIKLEENVENNEFDFNGIIPMPESLKDTVEGSQTYLGIAALNEEEFRKYHSFPWFAERYPNVNTCEDLEKFLENSDNEDDRKSLQAGRLALSNKEKYGFSSWYDWSIANWGTKWNSYNVRYIAHDDNHLVLEMDTAWDTPRDIWNKLSEDGFDVNGFVYGEVDENETIGNGGPFWVETQIEYNNDFTPYEER